MHSNLQILTPLVSLVMYRTVKGMPLGLPFRRQLLDLPMEVIRRVAENIDDDADIYTLMCTSKRLFSELLPILSSRVGVDPASLSQVDGFARRAGVVNIPTRDAGFIAKSLCIASVISVKRLHLHIDHATLPLARTFRHLLTNLLYATQTEVVIHTFDRAHWSDPHLLGLVSEVSSRWTKSLTIRLARTFVSIMAESF